MGRKDDIEVKNIIITSLEELLKNSAKYGDVEDMEDEDDPNDPDYEEGSSSKKKKPKVERRVSTRKRKKDPEVKNPILRFYDQEERMFYQNLTPEQKISVSILEKTIKNMNKDTVPLRFKILLSNIDETIKAIAIKKLGYLYEMDTTTGEYYKMSNWIESICKLPIGKYKPLPINKDSSIDDVRNFIKSTKEKLDSTVFGHEEAKDQIIRLLAQWISNPQSKGMVIGIHGSPGTGKTLLSKYGISKALDLPFSFLALGGASDSSWLDGHSYTYEGSTWGKIVDILMKAGCMNPVLYLDELDKVSQTYRGEEIVNTLIHLTDSTQNDKFQDKYFVDVDFDISRCLIIFSYNDEKVISPILKDRMIKIRTDAYKIEDKVSIAKKFLLPELCVQFNMKNEDILISDEHIKYIITSKVEEEDGVRNLKRGLESIVSNINLNIILSPEPPTLPIVTTTELINKYIKLPKDSDRLKMLSMYS
jgi:ATP-dependent Lon protease